MAKKWGHVDIEALKGLADKIEKLQEVDSGKLAEDIAKELAARLLAKVIKRTPVGQYDSGSGKVGGTLRRGWTAKTEQEAESGGGGPGVKKYVEDLQIKKKGTMYEIELINPVHYSSYVEFGHRTRNHEGWVDGQFMLTISEKELDAQAPAIIERKLKKALEEVFK
jgi:hypothetical protein